MKREDAYWAVLIGLLICQTYFQYQEYVVWSWFWDTDLPEDTLVSETTRDSVLEVSSVDLDCFPRNTKWENDLNSRHLPPQSFQCGDFQFTITSYSDGIPMSSRHGWSETRTLKEIGCNIDIDRIVCSESDVYRGLTFYRDFTATFERIDPAQE